MSTVVLVNPDIERLQERFGTITLTKLKPQPPLGLCYIAATLEAAGHNVVIIDGYAESLGPEAITDRILKYEPDITGFTITCLNVSQAEVTAKLLKKVDPDLCVVFGGPQVTLQPEIILCCPEADFGILGEGDSSFPLLVDALRDNIGPDDIPGLVLQNPAGNVRYTSEPLPIPSLDKLPFPSRHLLEWKNYDLAGDYLIPAKRVFTLSSSRGCPYRCSFCSSSVYWNRSYRTRSAGSIVDEIEILIRDFSADGLNFREDNFMVDKRRVKGICREILARDIKISWVCEARVDNVDRVTLELMRKAGLVGLWCGVESGSPSILKKIKKGYTVEQVRSAFRLFNDLGINTRAGFMIGFPYETEKDIQQTFDLAAQIAPSHAYFQTYVAFPRGELYDYIVKNGLYCDQWRDVYRVAPQNIDANRYREIEADLRERFDLVKIARRKPVSQLRKLGSRILVFCTAGIAVVERALDQLREENPDAQLDAVTNQALAPRISSRTDISRIHIYEADRITPDAISREWFKPLIDENYDAVLIAFSNALGQGYEEVIEVARLLLPARLISYNRTGDVSILYGWLSTSADNKNSYFAKESTS